MKASPDDSPPVEFTTLDFDRGAERLLGVIESSCDPDMPFVEQLVATLCACLDFLAGEDELAYLLTVAHRHRPDLASSYRRWVNSYAMLLRKAAERLPGPPLSPPFDEAYLIDAMSWKIRGRVAGGIHQPLPQMPIDLMRLVLPCFLGLEESDRIVGPSDLRALGYFNGDGPRGRRQPKG